MSPVPAEWQSILSLLPGYDPFRDAGEAWFEPDGARFAIDFFAECLQHVEGEMAGKPFLLEPWQQSIVANLWGWKQRDSYGRIVRRYREALIFVPRKCGKTPTCAGLALLSFFTDNEPGYQGYIAAGTREQAALLFRQAKGMVEREPELARRCRIYGGAAAGAQSRSIVREEDASFLRVISADASGQHGGNTAFAVIDELHVQPDRELVDVLRTSMASANRRQPLLIYVTTADYDRPSICNEIYDYACKVRDGVVVNPRFLPVIYEATREDDWTSEAVWRKANPNLGVSVSLDYLREECEKAKANPALENTFKRLHLNLKTETDVRAIPLERWDACTTATDAIAWRAAALERLRGQECWGGLDLGSTADLTALALLFRDGDRYAVLPWFWVPQSTARQREQRDRGTYQTWIRQGFISPTGGNTTDYDQVRADVVRLAGDYWLSQLAVDRLFQGAQLCTQLMGEGLPVVAFGQGFTSMAAPTKRLLELVLDGRFEHGGNPVLRWQAERLSTEIDAAGNSKPSKRKSTDRIDGMVAAIMALGLEMVQRSSSIYDTPGGLAL